MYCGKRKAVCVNSHALLLAIPYKSKICRLQIHEKIKKGLHTINFYFIGINSNRRGVEPRHNWNHIPGHRMNLPTTFLTISCLIVRTFANGTGFEQSESEDADLAHTIRMRASHIPRFVGKRTMGEDEVEKLLIKQQEENDDQEDEQKFLIDLLKSYDESLSESQHLSGDFNTHTDAESNSELSPFEREAKWAPRFVGKRRSPMFVGRRRAPLFIGKRYAPRFVGKRGAPMFVGRRGSPMFVGRRDSPLFVGKRENARPADTSYYVGGKR
ncbi:MIP-related peptides-like [Mytilus trossulus]|uniref:MIP-related peptides-like n=1 Tax=Mytilus trossulus TaxID=6551 RepID=UPI003005FFE0